MPLPGFVVCPLRRGELQVRFLAGGVSPPSLHGSAVPQRVQQQALGSLRPLAALQCEHVRLRRGERHLCSEAHELSGALVSIERHADLCAGARSPIHHSELSVLSHVLVLGVKRFL